MQCVVVVRALDLGRLVRLVRRIQEFYGGGGGGAQKSMRLHSHYERGTELTSDRGPGPVKWP